MLRNDNICAERAWMWVTFIDKVAESYLSSLSVSALMWRGTRAQGPEGIILIRNWAVQAQTQVVIKKEKGG